VADIGERGQHQVYAECVDRHQRGDEGDELAWTHRWGSNFVVHESRLGLSPLERHARALDSDAVTQRRWRMIDER
jgi:hypothetical protein